MPYAQSGAARIYYESHGEGEPLLFIHGAGGNHAAWWQQVARFRSSRCVLTVDLRGFGLSDAAEGGPDSLEFPEDALAVLRHAGAGDAVLVGQSIGAVAALRSALREPRRIAAVVLAHSVGGMSHDELTPLVRADRAKAETLPVLDRLLTRAFRDADPARTFLFGQLGTFNRAGMGDIRNLSAVGPTPQEILAAGVRVCFLAGEADAVIRPQTIARAHALLPGSILQVVPGAPHSMYWEAPQLFNDALEQILATLRAKA
ncbi:MAG: alpha/beta hydrolase [Burkholderiales bacterium]|nr:alpha/beta hydrolase [Burkholderiales bacterium]